MGGAAPWLVICMTSTESPWHKNRPVNFSSGPGVQYSQNHSSLDQFQKEVAISDDEVVTHAPELKQELASAFQDYISISMSFKGLIRSIQMNQDEFKSGWFQINPKESGESNPVIRFCIWSGLELSRHEPRCSTLLVVQQFDMESACLHSLAGG